MKLFNLKPKNFWFFLGETLEFFIDVFFRCFHFFHGFISSCFHFSIFSFLQMFLLFLCKCCCRFERARFTLRRFLPYILSFFFSPGFPGAGSQFCLEGCRTSHTMFGNYMISRGPYLNLSKYGDKLLAVQILTNFKHIS